MTPLFQRHMCSRNISYSKLLTLCFNHKVHKDFTKNTTPIAILMALWYRSCVDLCAPRGYLFIYKAREIDVYVLVTYMPFQKEGNIKIKSKTFSLQIFCFKQRANFISLIMCVIVNCFERFVHMFYANFICPFKWSERIIGSKFHAGINVL